MSAIRTHVLDGGRLWTAHLAAAVEVLGLAVDGYLTIESADRDTVRLTRTARPVRRLWPEQEILLRVFFGEGQAPGSVVCLREPGQYPVAQRLMSLAREGLLRDGMISRDRWSVRWPSVRSVVGAMMALAVFLAAVICGVGNLNDTVVLFKALALVTVAVALVVGSLGYAALRHSDRQTTRLGWAESRATIPFGAGPAARGAWAFVGRAGRRSPRASSPLAELFRRPGSATVTRASAELSRSTPTWWRVTSPVMEPHDFEYAIELVGNALRQSSGGARHGEDLDEETRRRLASLQGRIPDFSLQVFLDRPGHWGEGGVGGCLGQSGVRGYRDYRGLGGHGAPGGGDGGGGDGGDGGGGDGGGCGGGGDGGGGC